MDGWWDRCLLGWLTEWLVGLVALLLVGSFIRQSVSQFHQSVGYLGDNSISTLVVDWMASSIVKSATWLAGQFLWALVQHVSCQRCYSRAIALECALV